MNPFYNIWNYDYIQQQAQMQHHFSQVKQVQDTAKALSDFLDGCDKIDPAYQQQAMAEFCAVIAVYYRHHLAKVPGHLSGSG